nr:hypothetical protein [Tanacetum cinerariifolium]
MKIEGRSGVRIKRRRRDLSSDDVRNLATTSGRGRLKEDLESSTWRRHQDDKATSSHRYLYKYKSVFRVLVCNFAWDCKTSCEVFATLTSVESIVVMIVVVEIFVMTHFFDAGKMLVVVDKFVWVPLGTHYIAYQKEETVVRKKLSYVRMVSKGLEKSVAG